MSDRCQLAAPTVIESILSWAQRAPERVCLRLLQRRGQGRELTYGRLVEQARAAAAGLTRAGVRRGDLVVLVLDDSEPLISAFFGALLCGAVPSIFAFPSPKISEGSFESTVRALLGVCGAQYLVTSAQWHARLTTLMQESPALRVLDVAELEATATPHSPPVEYGPEDFAVLQHSSGTTGLKKGVALSNRVIVNQVAHCADALQLSSADHLATWLPLYHDMGLISCFLMPLMLGVPAVMMSPFDWLTDPVRLLRAIAQWRCTLVWQPNFAYQYYATRVPEAQTAALDLSSMRAFVNAAEPISARTHQLFLDRYARHGVRPDMLCAAYGMAENVLAATIGGIGAPLAELTVDWDLFQREHRAVPATEATALRRTLVSSGRAIPHNELRIVRAEGADAPDGVVGEIWVRSDSLFGGYFRRDDLTRSALVGGWYRSGDLGFMLEGSLYVTGRLKDMIIAGGANVYPQDVEEVASSVPGVHPGRVVAFGVYNNSAATEELVVMAESSGPGEAAQTALVGAIGQAVRRELGHVVKHIEIVPHMSLVKSSSGKISRPANRELFLSRQPVERTAASR